MKTNIFNFILIGTLLTTGVVSAYQQPPFNPPSGNVDSIVQSGQAEQKKQGDLWAKTLKTGFNTISGGSVSLLGYVIGDVLGITKNSFFTQLVLPGSSSQLRIGNNGGSIDTNKKLYDYVFNRKTELETLLQNNRAPLTVDLSGRGAQGTDASRNAAALFSNKTNICTTNTTIVAANTPAVRFASDYRDQTTADILARQIRLKGGNPGENKVLVAVDNQGNATWGTLVFTPVFGNEIGSACVDNPDYVGPPNQTACGALGDGSDCPPCNTLSQSVCGMGIMNHCRWEISRSSGSGTTVVGMNVTVQYDQSPVKISQAMCN